MSRVYSGTEYNKLKRGPDGSYERTLIKLTNKSGVHRRCDYNLAPSGEPKRVDDPIPWNERICDEGGIYVVLGERYVEMWLYYNGVGNMERAFLVQIPDDDNVKVIESDTKLKASSIIIYKEIDFVAIVKASLMKKDEELRKAEEEARKQAEYRRKERETSISTLETLFGASLVNLNAISTDKIVEAIKAIQEYGSLEKVPLHDSRVRFLPGSTKRKGFWNTHAMIMKSMQWFYTSNKDRNLAKGEMYARFEFSPEIKNLITQYRADLNIAGPFLPQELDAALALDYNRLFMLVATNPKRFIFYVYP